MTTGDETQTQDSPQLKGLRVLVVEDQAPIALQLEDMLVESECTVVGPASRVSQALKLLEEHDVDTAVLDLNVAGELVYPVAEALASRGLPFVFTTGYDPSALGEDYSDRRVLLKPFSRRVFLDAIRDTIDRA